MAETRGCRAQKRREFYLGSRVKPLLGGSIEAEP